MNNPQRHSNDRESFGPRYTSTVSCVPPHFISINLRVTDIFAVSQIGKMNRHVTIVFAAIAKSPGGLSPEGQDEEVQLSFSINSCNLGGSPGSLRFN
jgi:hypothetical protein